MELGDTVISQRLVLRALDSNVPAMDALGIDFTAKVRPERNQSNDGMSAAQSI